MVSHGVAAVFYFVAGNFVAFQILIVPVITASVQTELDKTIIGQFFIVAAFHTGFKTLFMRKF